MDKGLFIRQWNCQGIRRKQAELGKRAVEFNFILLSELWLNNDEQFILKNFNTVKKCRLDRRRGRVAVLVRADLHYQIYDVIYTANNKIEACGVTITWKSKPLILVSVYKTPNVFVSYGEWVRFFSQFPNEFVVGGDFNAHHPFWEDAEVCAEGRGLFDAMVEGDLHCLNAGSPTRFATPHSRATEVDITLSNSASFLAAHWETVNESW
ncbi:RNA-directed DNA polymerase from mobile element jockey [Ooceraea biroi]|uniref:RNA-directed DNA polymerase from mobile element jockey n=1 Tax=Ooceraea biroi TaxID=2015173 RepID=A0A026WHZ9_OOCBI|nr:RNA-directed DNA polymerase from mobile element jockey [Ooceraea biroi]